MTPARVASRPVFRCLHVPPAPRPQVRRFTPPGSPHPRPQHPAQAPYSRGPRPPDLADIEHVSLHRAQAIRRAKLIRRRNWLALGAALSMITPIIIVKTFYELPPPPDTQEEEEQNHNSTPRSRGVIDIITPRQADSPRAATDSFQGKKVVVAPGDKIIAAPPSADHPTATDVDTIELVPTGTSYVPYFPRTIHLPTSTGPETVQSEAEYTLLGLGIRKVSFLRVQVYVVGLYVRTASLHNLQNQLINTVNSTASALIPGEKEELRKALLDPEKSNQIWESILSRTGPDSVDMAFRVVPVRGTDFKHLQDGWMRGIASRTDEVRRKQAELLRQQAAEKKTIALPAPVDEGEFGDESFGAAMKEFKNLFQGRGKAPKGSVIILTRSGNGALGAMFQSVVKTKAGEKMGPLESLGEVRDERVSRLVWLMYLGGKNVSSEDARGNVVEGCVGIVERPVGTVEGMVQ